MKVDHNYREYIKYIYPREYRELIRFNQAKKGAMLLTKDEITLRLDAMGFCLCAISALSREHFFSTPCDSEGKYSLVIRKEEGFFELSNKLRIPFKPGVHVHRPCGPILAEGSYTLNEFNLLLDIMERSPWYRDKMDHTKQLPDFSILQVKVYGSLPKVFKWDHGKEIATLYGMSVRTAQRFFSNHSIFHRIKRGAYVKKILHDEAFQ